MVWTCLSELISGCTSEGVLACLDIPDLNDAEDFNLSKRQAVQHFGSPIQKEQIQKLIVQRIPINTKKTTNWCMSVWKAWSEHRGIIQRQGQLCYHSVPDWDGWTINQETSWASQWCSLNIKVIFKRAGCDGFQNLVAAPSKQPSPSKLFSEGAALLPLIEYIPLLLDKHLCLHRCLSLAWWVPLPLIGCIPLLLTKCLCILSLAWWTLREWSESVYTTAIW